MQDIPYLLICLLPSKLSLLSLIHSLGHMFYTGSPTPNQKFLKSFLKTTKTSWIKLFLPTLYLITEIERQFNYNQPCKLTKHFKDSPRFRYVFFPCSQHKVQQHNPEVYIMVFLWSLFLWVRAGEQKWQSNTGPSPATPETEVHERCAEKKSCWFN